MYRDGVVSARNRHIPIDEAPGQPRPVHLRSGILRAFSGARYTIAMNEGRLEEMASALATWRATPRCNDVLCKLRRHQ